MRGHRSGGGEGGGRPQSPPRQATEATVGAEATPRQTAQRCPFRWQVCGPEILTHTLPRSTHAQRTLNVRRNSLKSARFEGSEALKEIFL